MRNTCFALIIAIIKNTLSYDIQETLFVTGIEYQNKRISMDGNNVSALGEYLGNTGHYQCFLNCISLFANNSCSAVAIRKDELEQAYECFAYNTSLCKEQSLKLEVSTGFQLYDRLQHGNTQKVTCLAMISSSTVSNPINLETSTVNPTSLETSTNPTAKYPDNYFHAQDGALYYMDKTVKSFSDSGSPCENKIIGRAKIRNQLAKDAIISNMAKYAFTEVFIGLEMLTTNMSWQWKIDSSIMDPQSWAPGEPAMEIAVAASYVGTKVVLSDEFPNATLMYVCEVPPPVNVADPCPSNFKKVTSSNRCLYYSTTAENFTAAKQNCGILMPNAVLAAVYTPQQIADLASEMSKSSNIKFYVGMTWDFVKQKWIMNSGDAVSANLPFNINEPTHLRNGAAVLSSDSTIRTQPITAQRGYVCENIGYCNILYAFLKIPSGIYYVPSTENKDVKVICDNVVEGGGWTVIYSRDYRSPDGINFNVLQPEMENGFGNVDTGNYFVGTKLLTAFSKSSNMNLRVEFQTEDNNYWAKYNVFNMTNNYFYVSGYSGNAGDGLSVQSQQLLDTANTICPLDEGPWWFSTTETCDQQTNFNSPPLDSGASLVGRWVVKNGSSYLKYNNIIKVQMKIKGASSYG